MELQRIVARMMAGDDHDVLKLLKRDHAAVIELLDSYPCLTDPGDKETLVARLGESRSAPSGGCQPGSCWRFAAVRPSP